MNRRVILGILVVLALIVGAVAVGGVGYRIGVVQGLAANGKIVAPQGDGVPAPYVYGPPYFYGAPWGWGWGGGFGFLGCLFPLLGIFLVFALVRGLFWGRGWRRGWGGHGYGPGGADFGPGGQGVPPMFNEWHSRAHGTQSTESAPKPEGQQQ